MVISKTLNGNNIKQLFFIFFNLGSARHKDFFEFRIFYRQSKKSSVELTEDLVKENNKLISEYTGLEFDYSGQTHTCRLVNDLKYSRINYLNHVYRLIQQARFCYTESEFEEALFMGLFAFRGSIDMNRKLYAVDLLEANVSDDYVQQLTSLLISSEGIKQLNLNFRELQPEYVENIIRRNTQVRVNLRWFYDKYVEAMGKINLYKQAVMRENENQIRTGNINKAVNNNFIERLLFYKDKIVSSNIKFETLSESKKIDEINKLRQQLDFESKSSAEETETYRNQNIVNFARAYLPDECVSCKDKYDIKDRTFTRRNSHQPYLEIHHVISFGSENNSDVLENLVKLCPACHRALSRNRAEAVYQKELIAKIINNSPMVDDYLDNFMSDSADPEDKIDFVYEQLR